jgi:hypothetical protein
MTGRVKGFASWKPQRRTEPLLLDIGEVLSEYRKYLPLTVRQVFYRLVSKGYPKSEGFYDSVQDKCNRARRSGRIPFTSIRDDGVSRQAVESTLDLEVLARSREQERLEQAEVQDKLDEVNEALRGAFGLEWE